MKIHNIITITLKDVMFTINYLISSTPIEITPIMLRYNRSLGDTHSTQTKLLSVSLILIVVKYNI